MANCSCNPSYRSYKPKLYLVGGPPCIHTYQYFVGSFWFSAAYC